MDLNNLDRKSRRIFQKIFDSQGKPSQRDRKINLKVIKGIEFYKIGKRKKLKYSLTECPFCGSKDILKSEVRIYCYRCKKSFPLPV